MRVEQQNKILEAMQQKGEVEKKESGGVRFADTAAVKQTKGTDQKAFFVKDSTYLNPAKEEKKSIVEEIEESAGMDATDRKNQMAVLSHTTSEEDYEKMQEEGFSLNSTASNTIITVTDKIKMQIAKAGGDISCFGDSLTAEQLEKMTGSTAMAAQLEQAFREADLPLTEENLEAALEALEQAMTLDPVSDGAAKYMLDNEMEPTIENLYKAENSGSNLYTGSMAEQIDISDILGQVKEVIREAGLPVTEGTIADSKWLLDNQIPLTKENLSYLEQLKNLQTPVDQMEAARAIAAAVAEGRTPQNAALIEGYSLADRAQHAVEVVSNATDSDLSYLIHRGMELTVANLEEAAANRGKSGAESGDSRESERRSDDLEAHTETGLRLLTARRQLEEIRLAMTAEANYSLLKRGISIDTEPLVKLVEELKNEENRYYAEILEARGAEGSEENTALFAETTKKLYDMKSVPAYVLGIQETNVSDINGAHSAGTALKAAMEKANERYEPLMTAPRSDLGDSIEAAFANIDDILTDLSLENSEENRRAVRILAYNQLEITENSVLEMKAADEEVQRVFKNMTPAVVAEMIKEGINPLEMDFAALNRTAERMKSDAGRKDNERFSEYLWKLEKNNQITPEERSSFIGVYRLIHQVEQTDGAAIGALLHQGAELNLKNLLMAVRTGQKNNKMDISVDESFGEREIQGKQSNSITAQIMTAYQTNCMRDAMDALTPGRLQAVIKEYPDWEELSPEAFAKALMNAKEETEELNQEYIREQLSSLERCAKASDEIYQILEQYDIPNTMQNVLAMESMTRNRNQLYRQIFGQIDRNKSDMQENLEEIKAQLIKDFGEAVSEPKEMAEVQEALGKIAENVMKTMIESDEATSIDIKEARLMQAKISIQSRMAQKESYSVPVLVGDEVTNVSLKIVRGVEKRGIVDIMLESEMTGKIAATFRAKEKGIAGFIASDDPKTRETFEEHLDMIASMLRENEEETVDLNAAYIKDLDLNRFSGAAMDSATVDSATEDIEENPEFRVQTKRLYHIAESFLRTAKELF